MLKNLYRLISLIMVPSLVFLPARGFALPEGESIALGNGGADFNRPDAVTFNVNQNTDRVIIDYTGFNINVGETANFYQPNTGSIAVNRVAAGNPSEILGALNANGRIFILNPNGVLFGAGSQIDTSGLLASTLSMATSDASFMGGANSLEFYTPVETIAGKVSNAGNIYSHTGAGEFAALLGPNVENTNTGVISNVNHVVLASGDRMTVSLDPGSFMNIAISEDATVAALTPAGVVNSGEIYAGSKVLLTAQTLDGLFTNAINNSGIVTAKNIEMTADGNIVLSAGSDVKARNTQDEALVTIQSTQGNVDISDSDIMAEIAGDDGVGGDGDAEVNILAGSVDSWNSDIEITNSEIDAQVENNGDADINIIAGYYQRLNDEYVPMFDTTYDLVEHLWGEGKITVQGGEDSSFINAGVHGEGDASARLMARNIDITDSFVNTEVEGAGESLIDIFAGYFDYYHKYNDHQNKVFFGGELNVVDSGILADVGDGELGEWFTRAQVRLEGFNIKLDGSAVVAQQDQNGLAYVDIIAADYDQVEGPGAQHEYIKGGHLEITNPVTAFIDDEGMLVTDTIPSVGALVGGDGDAEVELLSGLGDARLDTMIIDNASVIAKVAGEGDAYIGLTAADSNDWWEWGWEYFDSHGADLNILNGSEILAEAGSGHAGVTIHAGDTIIDDSAVTSHIVNWGEYCEAEVEIGSGDYSSEYVPSYEYSYNLPGESEPFSTIVGKYSDWNASNGRVDIRNGSSVSALVETSGGASVDIEAEDINISGSDVQAKVVGYGEASVHLLGGTSSGSDYLSWNYYDYPENGRWDEYSYESMNRGSTVSVTDDSSVLASIGSGEDTASVDIESGDILVDNSSVQALTTDGDGYGNAYINFYTNDYSYDDDVSGTITLDHGSLVNADVASPSGYAQVNMNANNNYGDDYESQEGGINVLNGSSVLATVGSGLYSGSGYGSAYIYMNMYGGHVDEEESGPDARIVIDNHSLVKACVKQYGQASVSINANSYDYFNYTPGEPYGTWDYRYSFGGIDVLNNSAVSAGVGEGNAYVYLSAANINIADSLVEAFTTMQDGWGWANVDLINGSYAYTYSDAVNPIFAGNINVDASTVRAAVAGYGDAEVYFGPTGYGYDQNVESQTYDYYNDLFSVNIVNGSTVTASTGDYGDAEINFDVKGELNIEGSALNALVGCDGYALIDMNLYADFSQLFIADSTLIADVNGSGEAEIYAYNDMAESSLAFLGDLLEGLDLDVGLDFGGGPIAGQIRIEDSTIRAEAATDGEYHPMPTSAIIGMTSEGSITVVDGSSISAVEASGDALVGLMSTDSFIGVDGGSSVSATSADTLAAVGILAGGIYGEGSESVFMEGAVTADGGTGFGVVGIAGPGDLYLPGTISASGTSDAVPLAEQLLSGYYGSLYENAYLNILSPLSYGSGVLLGSLCGDVILGNVSADMVLGAALNGSIYQDQSGLVSGHLLGLVARNDIGALYDEEIEDGKGYDYDICGPIKTDVDVVAAYSFDSGNIVIEEANDLDVGLVLPFNIHDSEVSQFDAILGMAVAADNGNIFIRSQGDMTVNSVIAPMGGVFLQSEHGSIYAGKGWDPLYPFDLANLLFEVDWLADLNDEVGYAPVVFTFADPQFSGTPYNIYAGGYSYLSTPEGTIGVGTPDDKDPLVKGEVAGYVWPAVEAVTGKWPSPGIDLSRYTPDGLVYFYDESGRVLKIAVDGDVYWGNQIWPESIADPEISSGNPLLVNIDAGRTEGLRNALPDWFIDSLPNDDGYPDFSCIAGLTLEIGPPPQPQEPEPILDDSALLANALMRDLRAYYEIMNPTRFQSMVPSASRSFFAYHPLTPMDMTAFDDISLDAGAYDFISDNIKNKKKMAPYYGL